MYTFGKELGSSVVKFRRLLHFYVSESYRPGGARFRSMYDVHGFIITKKDTGSHRLIYTSENGMDKQKRGDLSSRSFFANDLEIVPAGTLNKLISAGLTVCSMIGEAYSNIFVLVIESLIG